MQSIYGQIYLCIIIDNKNKENHKAKIDDSFSQASSSNFSGAVDSRSLLLVLFLFQTKVFPPPPFYEISVYFYEESRGQKKKKKKSPSGTPPTYTHFEQYCRAAKCSDLGFSENMACDKQWHNTNKQIRSDLMLRGIKKNILKQIKI